ncbi:MAG: M55 family metallopeptidase [Bacillota bacterium]
MKVFISADLEGISGVVHGDQTSSEGKDYQRARVLMTGEVNAAIEGALAAGAGEVVVNDAHGSMRNILIEDIHPAAVLITGTGKPLQMVQGIDSTFSAAFFVGYHARMGAGGVLNHTISGGAVAGIWVNDVLVGETGLNAMVAGYFGVPVVLVTGDQFLAAEARDLMPWVHAVEVKQATGRCSAACLPPARARELVREGAVRALAGLASARPLITPGPVTVKLQLRDTGQADAAARFPLVEVVDPLTVAYTGRDYLEAFRAVRSMIAMAHT